MTSLPDLRSGWTWRTVADVGSIQLGRQRAPQHHDGEHMRPYLRVANVFEDRIDTDDVMSMNFTPDEFRRYRLEPGDILLNEGQTPELLGRPAMYRGDPEEVAFTNSLIRFKAGPDVLPEWALAVFRHHMHSGRFKRECRVTTNIAHLSATRFKTVEFPVPPLADQRRLADTLAERLEHVRQAEAGVRRVINETRALRRSVLAEVVGTPAQDSQAARKLRDQLLAQRPPSAAAPAQARLMTSPPPGFEVLTLDAITDPTRKAAYGILQPGPHTPGGVPMVRVGDIVDGVVRLDELKSVAAGIAGAYPRTRLQGGELLLTLVGTIGRAAVVPAPLAGANVARAVGVVPISPLVNAQYVALCLQAEPYASRLGSQAHEVARKTLNLADVRSFPLPIPSRAEQDHRVEVTSAKLDLADAALSDARVLLRRLGALGRSLLAATVTGRDLRHGSPASPGRIDDGAGSTDAVSPARTVVPVSAALTGPRFEESA